MSEPPKFEIRYDWGSQTLHWTIRGFWALGDVGAFAVALRKAIEPLGGAPYYYDCLCDSRDFPVQATDVSLALGEIDKAGMANRRGRVAIVVGSLMNRMQVRRTLNKDIHVFLSMDEAEAWLRQSPVEPR